MSRNLCPSRPDRWMLRGVHEIERVLRTAARVTLRGMEIPVRASAPRLMALLTVAEFALVSVAGWMVREAAGLALARVSLVATSSARLPGWLR